PIRRYIEELHLSSCPSGNDKVREVRPNVPSLLSHLIQKKRVASLLLVESRQVGRVISGFDFQGLPQQVLGLCVHLAESFSRQLLIVCLDDRNASAVWRLQLQKCLLFWHRIPILIRL